MVQEAAHDDRTVAWLLAQSFRELQEEQAVAKRKEEDRKEEELRGEKEQPKAASGEWFARRDEACVHFMALANLSERTSLLQRRQREPPDWLGDLAPKEVEKEKEEEKNEEDEHFSAHLFGACLARAVQRNIDGFWMLTSCQYSFVHPDSGNHWSGVCIV